jgi:hypothetical protein
LFHTVVSLPPPPFIVSPPRSPMIRSPPAAPLSVSAPSPPLIRSAPPPVRIVSLPEPPSTAIGSVTAASVVTASLPENDVIESFSTRSIWTLKGTWVSRSKRVIAPFWVTVISSLAAESVINVSSLLSPPLLVSLPSPLFQIMTSLPASPLIVSPPRKPVMRSLSAPPEIVSAPSEPTMMSSPSPPSTVAEARSGADSRIVSLPALPVTVTRIEPLEGSGTTGPAAGSKSRLLAIPATPVRL